MSTFVEFCRQKRGKKAILTKMHYNWNFFPFSIVKTFQNLYNNYKLDKIIQEAIKKWKKSNYL